MVGRMEHGMGPHAARGPPVWHACFRVILLNKALTSLKYSMPCWKICHLWLSVYIHCNFIRRYIYSLVQIAFQKWSTQYDMRYEINQIWKTQRDFTKMSQMRHWRSQKREMWNVFTFTLLSYVLLANKRTRRTIL